MGIAQELVSSADSGPYARSTERLCAPGLVHVYEKLWSVSQVLRVWPLGQQQQQPRSGACQNATWGPTPSHSTWLPGVGPGPQRVRSPPGDGGTLRLESHLSVSFGSVSNHALSFPVCSCPPSSWRPRGWQPCLCVSLWHLSQVSAWGVGCPGMTHQCLPPVLSKQAGAGSRGEDRADAGDLPLSSRVSHGLEFLGAVSCFLPQIGTQISIM